MNNNSYPGPGSDGTGDNSNEHFDLSEGETFETFTFSAGAHDNSNQEYSNRRNPTRNNSAVFTDQVFKIKTGEPTNNQGRIGSELARPNSAPMPQSFDETFLGSEYQNNFDFEAFKSKIQSGSFQQVRDEWAASASAYMGENSQEQEPYFKQSSEGRKKRSNSDPMIAESFFDAFTFDDVEDTQVKRGRTREVQDSKAKYKRSRSADAVDHMANMAASLFPGFDGDSDDDSSCFEFEANTDPAKGSHSNKTKRRNSEPLINSDFFNDDNFGFHVLGQKSQDMAAFTSNHANEAKRSEPDENKYSRRQRCNSEPMFSEEFANAFGEGSGEYEHDPQPNVDLFDSIQDVLGLDSSDHSFNSDEEKKPSASSSDKKITSVSLSNEFFDTVFEDKVYAHKSKEQDDVEQDELDLFVKKMFKSEKGNQPNMQQPQGHYPSTQGHLSSQGHTPQGHVIHSGGMGHHQRSRSLDAVAAMQMPMTGNGFPNGGLDKDQLLALALQNPNPTQEESLALYNMLFTGGMIQAQNNGGVTPFNSMNAPHGTGNSFGQFNTNANQATTNGNDDATFFVMNAIKATQNQLNTLHPLVMKSGNASAMEEITRAFKVTASASQHVMSSDLPNAVAVLSKAQSTIEVLWTKISGNLNGGKSKQHPQRVQSRMVDSSILLSDVQMGNRSPKHRDSDSVCSSVTGISIRSRSSSPAVTKSTDYDAQSVMSTKSFKSSRSNKSGSSKCSRKPIELKDLPPQDSSNPDVIMARLKSLMERTQFSQKELQKWDKKNGLPKSHSQTMVNSSRSRKQLQEGVVLKKWNGAPLIGNEKKSDD